MSSQTDYALWYLLIASIAATAAAFSAWAAISIRNLTKNLVDVTRDYADTVREELTLLLRREAEPRLFLDAGIVRQYPYDQCELTCVHLGAAGSPPVLINRAEVVLESLDIPSQVLARGAAELRHLLGPGKRWCRIVTSNVGAKLLSLARPNILDAIRHWKWEHRLAAYLLVRLHYKVADEPKPPVEKQFQVFTTPTGQFLRSVGYDN